MALAQPNSYAKVYFISFRSMLIITTAKILKTREQSTSLTSIQFRFSLRYLPLNSAQVIETQQSSLSLEVTGTYPSGATELNPKSVCPISTQGAQSSSSQDTLREEATIFCHCDQRGENMADTTCSKRGTARGMEPGSGLLVRNLYFFKISFYN
jgi:hypothetical protein